MEGYDVIVIGGGLLGCFALRALARYSLKIALLEAREDVCTGISRANTAIIYSGCDTKPGTLKSEMCVRAAQTFDELCSDLGVRYSPCGSLMISFGPNGEETLGRKLAQGIANGARGIKLLTRDEVLALEPNLSPNVTAGLYAPEAGTVIPWELGIAAVENAVANGAELLLNTPVLQLEKTTDGYVIDTGGRVIHTRSILNCAGLSADDVLEKVSEPTVRIFPEAGDYYVLDTKTSGFIRHVIFHEPEEKGKGLTLVPTVDGNILLGPSKVDSGDKSDTFPTSAEGLEKLRTLVGEVIPTLPMAHVIRSFGAIRPNPFFVHRDPESGTLVREDKSISNFILHESDIAPNFLSLIGIKTPGLTCANELGLYAADRIVSILGGAPKNEAFSPNNPDSLHLSALTLDERAKLVQRDSAYGRIVCRCRGVTEGEIIDSIRRKPGAVTVDGVKRRTGACSGRCQGGFCAQRIIEILARELSVSPADIRKDRPGSYIIGGFAHDEL